MHNYSELEIKELKSFKDSKEKFIKTFCVNSNELYIKYLCENGLKIKLNSSETDKEIFCLSVLHDAIFSAKRVSVIFGHNSDCTQILKETIKTYLTSELIFPEYMRKMFTESFNSFERINLENDSIIIIHEYKSINQFFRGFNFDTIYFDGYFNLPVSEIDEIRKHLFPMLSFKKDYNAIFTEEK